MASHSINDEHPDAGTGSLSLFMPGISSESTLRRGLGFAIIPAFGIHDAASH